MDEDVNFDFSTMSIDAKYEELKGIIRELEENNIDVTSESKELEELYKKYIDYHCNIDLELLTLRSDLYEYENQFKIVNRCKELSNGDINNLNVGSINRKVIELIDLLGRSISKNKNTEKKIRSDSYKIIYSVLKNVLANAEDQSLFDIIREDENAVAYISNLVKEDIASLRDKNFIKELLYEINNSVGIKKYYNLDLIFALAISENEQVYDRKIENFNEVAKERNTVILSLEKCKNEADVLADKKKQLDETKQVINTDSFVKITFYSVSSLIIAGLMFAGGAISKRIATSKIYKTSIETYDSFSKETNYDEDYIKKISDDTLVTVTKYTEWELIDTEYRKDDYKRTATVCDVVDYKTDLPLYEYLKIDSGYLSSKKTFTDWADFILDEAKYEGDKYVVTRYVQDLTDEKLITSEYWVISPFIMGVLCSLFWYQSCVSNFLSEFKKESRKKEKYKETLAEYKERLLEAKKEYEELILKYNLLTKLVNDEYEKLPVVLKNDEKVKEKVLTLDDSKGVEIPLLDDKK